MLARQRQEYIAETVRRSGTVRVRDLAEELGVSEMTVRRDLDALEAQRRVEKVHGGAARPGDPSSFEPGFDAKQARQRTEKLAIARLALDHIHPGSAIALTAGTTTWTLARELVERSPSVPGVVVVTNAPTIAQALYGALDITVVLTGGIRTPSDALVGPIATSSINHLHVDTLFLGVHGMDSTTGYSTPNLAEAEVDQALIGAARRVVVVADHTKWGVRGLAQIAPLDRADVVISDDGLPTDGRRALEGAGPELELARAARTPSES